MVSPGNNAFILIEQGLINSSRRGGDSVVLFHPGQLEIKTQHDIWLRWTQAQDRHPLYQEQLLKSCSRAFQQLERLVQLQCMWLHPAFTVLSIAFLASAVEGLAQLLSSQWQNLVLVQQSRARLTQCRHHRVLYPTRGTEVGSYSAALFPRAKKVTQYLQASFRLCRLCRALLGFQQGIWWL